LDSGTLTPLLKRVELEGLITRTRDTGDERQVRISLTPAGNRLQRDAMAMHEQLKCKLVSLDGHVASLRSDLKVVFQLLQSLDG
jgi:MarR family transcriptional regulator, organic hydroperoxide resistance regulator